MRKPWRVLACIIVIVAIVMIVIELLAPGRKPVGFLVAAFWVASYFMAKACKGPDRFDSKSASVVQKKPVGERMPNGGTDVVKV